MLYMGGKGVKATPKIPAVAQAAARSMPGRVADTAINLWPWNPLTPTPRNYVHQALPQAVTNGAGKAGFGGNPYLPRGGTPLQSPTIRR